MKKIISKASWIALFALILIGTLFFAVKTGIKIANGEDNDKRFFTHMQRRYGKTRLGTA